MPQATSRVVCPQSRRSKVLGRLWNCTCPGMTTTTPSTRLMELLAETRPPLHQSSRFDTRLTWPTNPLQICLACLTAFLHIPADPVHLACLRRCQDRHNRGCKGYCVSRLKDLTSLLSQGAAEEERSLGAGDRPRGRSKLSGHQETDHEMQLASLSSRSLSSVGSARVKPPHT